MDGGGSSTPPNEVQTQDNLPALQIIQELVESNQITNDLFRDLSFKLTKLHQAFTQSCSNEQVLMRRTRDYDKELKSQKLVIQNTAQEQQEHRSLLTSLRQYVTNIQVELDATQEQIASTDANTRVKQKEKEKLEDKVSKAHDDEVTKLAPTRNQVQNEISSLEKAISDIKNKIVTLCKFNNDLKEKITNAEEQLMELDKKKRTSNQKMLEIGSIPVKTRQKCAQVETNHNAMLAEEKNSNIQLQTIEQSLYQSQLRSHDLEVEFQHVSNDIEGLNYAISSMKSQFDDLRRQLSDRTAQKQQLEFDSRKASKQLLELDKEVSTIDQKLENIGKDTERKQLETMRMEEMISRMLLEKQSLEGQLKTMRNDKEREIDNVAKLRKQYNQQLNDKEEAIKALMSMETVNEKLQIKIHEAHEERERKQGIMDNLTLKERDLTQQLADASLIRDRKARDMASMKKKTRDAKAMAMEKNLDYLDLCRKLEQDQIKMREFSELYEKVKLDRNRHVNTIQTSKQLIVEMKEKIKILENEIEVLRLEYEQIASYVQLQKNQLHEAFKKRDATKVELKKAENAYKDLMSKIDFQASETERMNHILQSLEDQINYQQGRYSAQADDCAERQRMLIDKQDELCIIYEQFNRHQEIMRVGETAISDKEEELKLLNLQLRDFTRRIDVMQRKLPQLRSYNEEIRELKRQLKIEKREVEKITKKIEVPDMKERQRAYCGHDFTLKELEDKVSLYEQRINSKEQQLWEKQILLREIQDKINAITGDANRDTTKTQRILEKGGRIRAETMAARRKKLATLSELAIYQAQKIELKRQKEEIKQEINAASERTARGEAFDDYSARILRMETRDMYLRSQRITQIFDEDEDDENRPKGRQKFDAYPTADGLSRPYGAFPVFQPAPPPGYIRHYRKEAPVPIEM
ncbi:hypothetical protein TRFO_05948 [Tritrichomonas foetus]|uniref:Uncharacterized protein n=1 Tax=Tritrichomonas foetus TaxID=1144522 RepID=A0A1J4K7H7_9EUKA|nr:hypothetical protein TRFO_05948 [Tritrichomonas foetus]|eukprot:OHT05365.1 hypothetical protein TRFO_05948 [Tritrichomonas foetus]